MADDSPPVPDNIYDDGVKRIRETAKWLTVSLGSIGAVLVGGIQLTGIGKLDGASSRFGDVKEALGLACVGIACILGGALYTMTRKPAGAADINKVKYSEFPQFFAGSDESGATLFSSYVTAAQERTTTFQALLADRSEANNDAYNHARLNLIMVVDRVRGLISAVNYTMVARAWRVTIGIVIVGVVLVVAGVSWFSWAVNPPESAKATAVTPGVLDSPRPGKVTFFEAGRVAVQAAGGTGCRLESTESALLLKTTDSGPDVIITGHSPCQQVRLILVPAWGTFT